MFVIKHTSAQLFIAIKDVMIDLSSGCNVGSPPSKLTFQSQLRTNFSLEITDLQPSCMLLSLKKLDLGRELSHPKPAEQ